MITARKRGTGLEAAPRVAAERGYDFRFEHLHVWIWRRFADERHFGRTVTDEKGVRVVFDIERRMTPADLDRHPQPTLAIPIDDVQELVDVLAAAGYVATDTTQNETLRAVQEERDWLRLVVSAAVPRFTESPSYYPIGSAARESWWSRVRNWFREWRAA